MTQTWTFITQGTIGYDVWPVNRLKGTPQCARQGAELLEQAWTTVSFIIFKGKWENAIDRILINQFQVYVFVKKP